MKMLALFIVLTILNTIIQTVKSIATVKCGKTSAALVNAVAYGLYTYVVFFTAYEGIDLHAKALITAFANLVGVWIVKYIEEKMRKDKLWKVEATVYAHNTAALDIALTECRIPHNYINAGKYSIFNCYCATQEESRQVKKALDEIGAKFFVSESKTLA